MKRNRRTVVVEVAILAVAVSILAVLSARPGVLERVRAFALPTEPAAPPQAPPAAAVADSATTPSPIMTVPPRGMYAAFADQYRVRPDRRVLLAFGTLTVRWGQWRGEGAPGRFAAGAVRDETGGAVIPLLRERTVFREAVLPVPSTFSNALALLDEWVAAMDRSGGESLTGSRRIGDLSGKVNDAVRLIDMVDPRYVVAGLTALEDLWREGARDAKILRAAARGYATLVMVLHPDEMALADPFAAESLAFLALSRRADPKLSVAREEALLATVMGYRAHAAAVLAGIPLKSRAPADRVLDAYLRQDLSSLRRAQEENPGVLGAYLLARHYREIGLRQEAKEASRRLIEGWPTLYPSAAEIIHSGDLGEAKVLTVVYPHEITEQIRVLVDPAALAGLPSWIGLAREIVDGKVMPFSEFEGLLDAWRPFGSDDSRRFIVDAGRVKRVFRSLYADAVQFRFRLLFDRWAVRDEAQAFVKSLAADKAHPLVLLMDAIIAAGRGDRGAADVLFEKVISHPDSGGRMAFRAQKGLSDDLTKIRLLRAAVGRLDGRPGSVIMAGWLLGDVYNCDLAARFYAVGLAANPYACDALGALARVRGTDSPLREALKSSPNNYKLLEEAGKYLAGKRDAASKEAGERALGAAQSLAPSVAALAEERARVLSELGRHGEAIGVLNAWIERYGDDGLTTIVANSQRAETYLKMGRPRDALRVLGNDAESMQGNALAVAAEIHEALGDPAAAWDYHRRGIERYPTNGPTSAAAAAFLWRAGRYDEAAKLIARARPGQKRFDRWYSGNFMSAFKDASDDEVERAVKALAAHGAPSDELSSLAYDFLDAGRKEVAFRIASGVSDPHPMVDVERGIDAYRILKEWKGRDAAAGYLRRRIPPARNAGLMLVLFKCGQYEAILEYAADPGSYGRQDEEWVWLQKLLAWLALGKNPGDMAAAFDAHYRTAVPDKYHSIGRCLLGLISRDELLDIARTAKDRCEFAYYIGYSERMNGNFAEATQWYHLCKETLLRNNGELHWAAAELFWWAHMGTENRHRLMADDVAEYRKARMRDVAGRSFI